MALERKDRVQEETTTTGTGAVTLNGTAPAGFRIFAGTVSDGATVRYLIENADRTEWEIGEGVFDNDTTDTLTRVTIFASSNAGSLVDFSAGTKKVTQVFTAKDGDEGKFWLNMPTVTRVSDTQITIADASGANGYASLFQKGTVLKWTNSGTKQAMVISASYASDVVTINLIGDAFVAGFSDVKYAVEKAKTLQFAIVGTLATGTDLAGQFYAPFDMKVFGADARVATAGTTNATTFDINDDGTTVFTTKPSIASTATSDLDNTADSGTVIAEDSKITVDIDAVSTTAPIDAYITLYFAPNNNQYLS